MHAVVAGAAPAEGADAFYRDLLAAADVVVAADAAAEWCVRLGRRPDAAVGDFDSAAPGAVERLRALGVPVREYLVCKDVSDLDIAVAEARSRGASSLTLTAAAGQRLDHTLATLGTLAAAADIDGALEEPSLAAWVVDAAVRPALALAGPAGALVSVFAIGGTAGGVSLRGLSFPLEAAELPPLSSLGLSNTLLGGPSRVSVVEGRLLVVSEGTPEARAVCVRSH